MMKEFLTADARNPRMGLNNTDCEDPVYWCRCHQIWLSEEDIEFKKCMAKPTLDMIATRKCGYLERKDFNEWYSRLTLPKERRNEHE